MRATQTRGKYCPQGHDAWVRRQVNQTWRWVCKPCENAAGARRARERRQDPCRRLFELARQRATEKAHAFTITEADICAAWPADGKCPVLGVELRRAVLYADECSPTLDRIDPDRGYEPGNIVVMSLRANRAKGNMSVHEIEQLYHWMRQHPAT